MTVGDRRLWRTITGQPGSAEQLARVIESTTIDGQAAFRVLDEGVEEVEYIAVSAQSVRKLPGPLADAVERDFGAVEMLRFGHRQGETLRVVERRISRDVDGDGRPDTLDLTIDLLYVGDGSVTVPAGTFASAAQIRTTARLRSTLSGQAQPQDVTVVEDQWLVPKIGQVKVVETTQPDGQTQTRELAGYALAGQRNDSDAPRVISSEPAQDELRSSIGPIRLRFSEALDVQSIRGAWQLKNSEGQEMLGSHSYLAEEHSLLITPMYALGNGSYTLTLSGAITDRLGNVLAPLQLRFTIDSAGPRLIASQPTNGDGDAAVGGEIALTFDRPVSLVNGAEVLTLVLHGGMNERIELPARFDDTRLLAPLTQALPYNRSYSVSIKNPLKDASGVPARPIELSFKTTQGPLSRPQGQQSDFESAASTPADINGDGLVDLISVGRDRQSQRVGAAIRLRLPGGGFAAQVHYLSNSVGRVSDSGQPVIADFNADGRLDIALVHYGLTTETLVLLQQAGGSFGPSLSVNTGSSSAVSAIALVGAVSPALVYNSDSGLLVTQLSNGAWSAARTLVPTGGNGAMVWRVGDLNNDGRQDLAWLRYRSDTNKYELAWSLQTAAGGFATEQSQTLPGTGGLLERSLELVDMNGDGYTDLLVSGPGMLREQPLLLLRNDGSGGFQSALKITPATDQGPGLLAIADMNGDGRLDVVSADVFEDTLSIYLQGSDGLLQARRVFERGPGLKNFSLVDLNGDGRTDVVGMMSVVYARPWTGLWPLASP
ncbi:FG-GAP-like repeat-containing protein [Paucibacter sp. M5-1]|uniref:FG-GAP-like repeat-containing protein n=1 Tax=Paucibacter sp. M5-1 TaxID=3015998 RepID=UPI0022B91165|nr:FG-GAP-like repeat-containing protein [Paucibacter sp. M5-1]MCZ7881676.1 FG-GAP-like repeat-containing protein [Paucibacter sp. M5-1]